MSQFEIILDQTLRYAYNLTALEILFLENDKNLLVAVPLYKINTSSDMKINCWEDSLQTREKIK